MFKDTKLNIIRHNILNLTLERISEDSTPYEFRQNATNYPFDSIYESASLSGKTDSATLKKQLELLQNENPIIRYWAIVGLKSHSEENIKPFKKQVSDAMEDSYPPVAVIASALAFDSFQSKIAEDNLKQFAKNDNMHIALLAVNEMLYFKDKSPFMETVKNVHQLPGRNYNVKAACMDYLGLMGLVENSSDNEQ